VVARLRPGVATATNSSFTDSYLPLSNSDVNLTSNLFTRSKVELSGATPVVRGNTFVDTDLPLDVSGAEDLAGIGPNTATGTGIQQVFQIRGSSVTTEWTVDGTTVGVYSISDVTVFGDMTVEPGVVFKNFGALNVAGGTLEGSGAIFTSLGDDSVNGDSNGDGDTGAGSWPGIVVGNGFDISNLPKDAPGGKAVDASGSTVNPALVSSHEHACIPPPAEPPLPIVFITIWDVEFGLPDGKCPPTYTESKPHP
jgi:hypothetical protein